MNDGALAIGEVGIGAGTAPPHPPADLMELGKPQAVGILENGHIHKESLFEMALGAAKALGAKAGKDVAVVGFDGTPDGLKAVEAGTLFASVAQQPAELGKAAVQNAVKAARGEKTEAQVMVPVKVVTAKNVADFS